MNNKYISLNSIVDKTVFNFNYCHNLGDQKIRLERNQDFQYNHSSIKQTEVMSLPNISNRRMTKPEKVWLKKIT